MKGRGCSGLLLTPTLPPTIAQVLPDELPPPLLPLLALPAATPVLDALDVVTVLFDPSALVRIEVMVMTTAKGETGG